MTVVIRTGTTQTIVAACLAALMGCSIASLGYLIYRNRSRAKELLFAFASFELILITEICLETWVRPRA